MTSTNNCPEIESLADLRTPEQVAEKLGIKATRVSEYRFQEPPLPYIRFGSKIWFAENQVVWWLNEYQKLSVIKRNVLRNKLKAKSE